MTDGWRDKLSTTELRALLRVSDARGAWSIAANWALVGLAFAVVAVAPNPVTIVVALFVIGGRQLGLGILLHDAAHRTLFRSRRLNDWAANWLCGYPVASDVHPYRPYHLQHHARTWTADDPDLRLVQPFPITPASLRRKVVRDLTGQTGVQRALATVRLTGTRQRTGILVTNALLFGVLAVLGHPALYLLWVVAWLTTYSLVMRIRSIAEHAMVPDPSHALGNARTTLARWWERLLIAPNHVNYHLEHHLLMTVPHYRLPRLHRVLRARGALEGACVTTGYAAVLRRAASRS